MKINNIIKAMFEHFQMLCFTSKKLPWYLTVYKNFLYFLFSVHQVASEWYNKFWRFK